MQIQLLNGEMPERAHEGDAGLDLKSAENFVLGLGEVKTVRCGFKMALDDGYVAMVCSRSGLAAKNQIIVLNAPGIIDSGYRGEVMVILANMGPLEYHFKQGDRIAQMVITKVESLEIKEVKELTESARGTGGFGSTGVEAKKLEEKKVAAK